MTQLLANKKGLVVGIANEHSIAWGCAKAFHEAGAELAVTYQGDKAKPYVQPLAEQLSAPIVLPLDVRDDIQMDVVFDAILKRWGKLDFLHHAIAFAPKADLQGKFSDVSRAGFLEAMDISCYSFIRMAHFAAPLMNDGGCLLTTTYYGGQEVIPSYGLMGPVKSALEGTVKYLAAELGPKNIRVNALSPGPIATRAAGGIAGFDALLKSAHEKSPLVETVSIDSVGAYARFLVSDEARLVTGSIAYVDAGYHILGG
jgi:enoyl-[acyl-carrier protein] reductase I